MKMKKIFKYILIAGLSLGLVSCDKFFDDMEGDLSKVAAEDLLNTENGLLALLADLYSNLPSMSMSDNDKYQMFGNGARDVPSYGNTVAGFWNYTAVRAVNSFLQAVEDCRANGVLDDVTADHYKGEALFIRAYYYFASVRIYGGVPIVDEVLDKYYGTEEADKLYFPVPPKRLPGIGSSASSRPPQRCSPTSRDRKCAPTSTRPMPWKPAPPSGPLPKASIGPGLP